MKDETQVSSSLIPHPPSLVRTFGWAFEGLGYAWRTQRNIKIHTAISLAVSLVGLWVGLPWRDWAVIALTMGVVFSAELINTAIEAIVDLASPQWHPLAKIAKDTAAAAVLVLALAAVVVGALLLGPPILARLGILS
jgi:diacylglycerol kinase